MEDCKETISRFVDEISRLISERIESRIEEILAQKAATRTEDESEGLLTRGQVGAYLGRCETTLIAWQRRGLLQPVNRGNRVYYRKEEVLKLRSMGW